MCGVLVAYPAGFELDHIKSLDHKGSDTDDNCQVLCIDVDGVKVGCHRIKTAQDQGYKGGEHVAKRRNLSRFRILVTGLYMLLLGMCIYFYHRASPRLLTLTIRGI